MESKLTPVAVAGGRRFRVVSAGNFHSCGITPADVLFCWGSNRYGVMGTAAAPDRTPVKVGGARTWRNVSAGFSHTCGATTTNAAYCWGNNSNYQLGNGKASFARAATDQGVRRAELETGFRGLRLHCRVQ